MSIADDLERLICAMADIGNASDLDARAKARRLYAEMRAKYSEHVRDAVQQGDPLLKRARNLLIDAQNFIGPTTVWRDEELMLRLIRKFIEDTRPPVNQSGSP